MSDFDKVNENVGIYPNFKIESEMKNTIQSLSTDLLGIFKIFDESRNFIPAEKIFVMQAINNDFALVHISNKPSKYGYSDRYENLSLLFSQEAYFYDNQEINVSSIQEVKQIGIYRYITAVGYSDGSDKYIIVPVVVLITGDNN